MSCLDRIIDGTRVIIGVRDYASCNTPESRLYINDLPGLSLKSAANITPEQFNTGAAFLQNCTIMATRHVFDEFASELQPYFNFSNIVETRDLMVFSTEFNASSATERGIIVKRWRSEAARLLVERVYLSVDSDGSATIKVIDGDTTTEYEADLTAGINEVHINYRAENEQIKIVFDQTNFGTYNGAWNKSGGSCSSCGGNAAGKGLFVGGWDGTREVSNTYGVGVMVHAQCYEEEVLCSLIPKMYFLMWYKSGIIAFREHIATNRINHIATFGKEQAKESLATLEEEYKEKYAILVKGARNFLRTTKGECIACNGIRYAQAIP